MAAELRTETNRNSHAGVSKEQIVVRDPKYIFLDVATLRLGGGIGALHQLLTDPVYRSLQAPKAGRLFFLFPNVSYAQNLETVHANAHYIGKVLFPERFADIDPMKKAEKISSFLNGAKAFQQLNAQFNPKAFASLQP